jgi:RNA polymerase sigma-70 factor, ECF subfamily
LAGVIVRVQVDITMTASSFDDFYADHYRSALGLAWTLTGSRGAAEELVQDSFIEVFRRWSTVGAYDDPAAYLRRVVSTRAVSRWRKAQRELAVRVRVGGRRADTERSVDQPLRDAEFWSAVRALPARQAQIVALHYVEELTVVEIAEVLGVKEGTVKTSLFRARKTLSIKLAPMSEAEA